MIVTALHRRVSPPEEMTRSGVAVKDLTGNFNERPVRIQREARHHLQTTHRLHFAHPYRLFALLACLDSDVNRHKGGRAVMLRPVKLDTTGDPRSQQTNQRRFHHFVVVDKVTLTDFIVGTMNTPTELR